MEFTQEMVDSLTGPCQKDRSLAEQLAEQLLDEADPLTVARMLLSDRETVLWLLANHIATDLSATVEYLSGVAAPKKRNDVPKRQRTAPRQRRHRLSEKEITQLKAKVCTVLRKKVAQRRELQKVVGFPSVAAYNRIMKELVHDDKTVQVQGTKSKAVYRLRGAVTKKASKKGTSKKPAMVVPDLHEHPKRDGEPE